MRTVAALLMIAGILVDALAANALVQITSVDNVVNFPSWSGGNLSETISVCIYNDADPGSQYAIRASGNGPGSSFKLRRGTTSDYVTYDVDWRDSGGSWTPLQANVASGTLSGASQVLDCGGSTNASVRFSIAESELLQVQAGNYSGSVSLELMAR